MDADRPALTDARQPAGPAAGLAAALAAGLAAAPGIRTLRSRRFRLVLAATLWLVGGTMVALLLTKQAADPRGGFAIDFAAYHHAAGRLAGSGSPYAPEMLLGRVDAQGLDHYLYPPPLAQLLVPIAGMDPRTAAWLWLALQSMAVLAAVWLAARAGGARRSLETLLWCGVAATYFLPAFDTLWKGNVSGFLALLVAVAAIGGAGGSAAVSLAVLLKVAPAALLPGLAADGRRSLLIACGFAAAVVLVSVAMAPGAWADYSVVLPNLLAGSADYATNLAPAAILDRAGPPGALVTLARLATLAVAVACALMAWRVGRKPTGRPAAVGLGSAAMLLLPAAIWYHYLIVLLPLGAMAWPRGSLRLRVALVASAAIATGGIAWLPFATIGGAAMLSASLVGLWPRPRAAQLVGEPAAAAQPAWRSS